MTDTAASFQGHGAKPYRAYVLGALLVVYTFNFIDRILVGIIQEPIKLEFGLTDFQLGLLGGPAFAILYTFLGIPIARLAERANRMRILAICIALWSAMTAVCGLAQEIPLGSAAVGAEPTWLQSLAASLGGARVVDGAVSFVIPAFFVLLAARVGVGIGEAGCTPPANSVISDYFPSERRATALSIYALGIPIGSMIAAVGGGWIATELTGVNIQAWLQSLDLARYFRDLDWGAVDGWRIAFGMLGVPGVALAVIVLLTVKEPPRSAPKADTPTFLAGLSALAKKPTFWHIAFGSALASFVGYGVGQYLTSFMIRTHGFSLFEAATIIGVVLGLCAAIGTFSSGFLADRISLRHPNALSWLPALGFAVATPLYLASFILPNIWMALPALMIAAICHYFYLGPMYAITQGVVAPRMRATAVAVLLFVVNLIGYGLGPPVIGALSDFLANGQLATHGLTPEICAARSGDAQCASGVETGLRWAMMIGVCGYLWAGLHFLISARTLRRDWVA